MIWFRRILVIGALTALLVGGWVFAAGNGEPVFVYYVFGRTAEKIALWKALLAAFGLGAASVGALALFFGLRHGLVVRRYRRLLGGLESEIHQLRNLPLAPDPESPGGSRAGFASPPGGALGRDA
ncbi:MAG TPA: LapA family protein [Myxococcota bacterium]|nr:LapA family protein [Myxococcota bacterium]